MESNSESDFGGLLLLGVALSVLTDTKTECLFHFLAAPVRVLLRLDEESLCSVRPIHPSNLPSIHSSICSFVKLGLD